jgi:hypothetical protein
MKAASFQYEVTLRLRLDRKEVEELIKACEMHYDHKVRAMSDPKLSERGAVLNGARNTLHFRDEDGGAEWAEIRVTWDDLDTLAKATEIHAPYAHTEGASLQYFMRFQEMMRQIVAERKRIDALKVDPPPSAL